MRARRLTETIAEFSGKMSVVAKAASIGDFAERLGRASRVPAMEKSRCMLQTKRINEFTASGTALSEQLLEIAQRDSCLGRDLGGTKIGIGNAVVDDTADTREQFVSMPRNRARVRRGK